MAAPKQKHSVTLDEDPVAELRAASGALSTQVNEAVRLEVERRHRQQALVEFLAELDASDGPLTSSEDERAIERYLRLLGGPA